MKPELPADREPSKPANGEAAKLPNGEASKSEAMVVGIGASAGGLAALKTFFELVPAESGLAFVVVVHLSPDHESHLAELLQPGVRIPVEQVNSTALLKPNHVLYHSTQRKPERDRHSLTFEQARRAETGTSAH